jgi:hypothetical protein
MALKVLVPRSIIQLIKHHAGKLSLKIFCKLKEVEVLSSAPWVMITELSL